MTAHSLISGYPFVHATCAIYIINVFHSDQHSQHPENGLKTARNSGAR